MPRMQNSLKTGLKKSIADALWRKAGYVKILRNITILQTAQGAFLNEMEY